MKSRADEPKESPALVRLAELRRDAVARPTPEELDRGLDALFARVALGRARRGGVLRWSLVGVAAAMCLLLGFRLASDMGGRGRVAEPVTLAYQIEGGSVLEGGYLREAGNAGVKLLFNEGSRVVLMPGARGRIRAVGKEGARVAIDHGLASFWVTPNHDRQWWVEVGPFSVVVKGTVFTASWDPSSEQFALNLRSGRVVVSGPLAGGDVALRSGQKLVVKLPEAETLITEERSDDAIDDETAGPPAPTLEPSVALAPPAVSERSSDTSASPAPAPSAAPANRTDGKRPWSDQVASGQWDRILAEVDRAGLETTLDRVSSEDLFALAAAARYRRRVDLARSALLSLRRRFPDSPRSRDATFLLGRVEESRQGGKARAIEWYDEYLARAATGGYAAEALGRKMILTHELRGRADARPLAEEYLRRFPSGSYAGSARALCSVP